MKPIRIRLLGNSMIVYSQRIRLHIMYIET